MSFTAKKALETSDNSCTKEFEQMLKVAEKQADTGLYQWKFPLTNKTMCLNKKFLASGYTSFYMNDAPSGGPGFHKVIWNPEYECYADPDHPKGQGSFGWGPDDN